MDVRQLLTYVLLLCAVTLPVADVLAEDRSFYSPVIYIDKEQSQILISTSASVFYIEVPDAAKPHMEKLPVSGLVDFIVEMRGEDKRPLIKTWNNSGNRPILAINERLGFVRQPAWIQFRKVLQAG